MLKRINGKLTVVDSENKNTSSNGEKKMRVGKYNFQNKSVIFGAGLALGLLILPWFTPIQTLVANIKTKVDSLLKKK